jgi:membrane peptidoglycan carboxypeptidase
MAVIPEMIFSPDALAAIRETLLTVMQSEEGRKSIEEICRAEGAGKKNTTSHRRRVV